MLADLRASCSQLDPLADHVTSFAKMMTRRSGTLPAGSSASKLTTSPNCTPSPPGSARTWTPLPPGSPCPIAPAPWRATSTGSRPSRRRCTAAPASISYANASSLTPRDRSQNLRQSPSRWQATLSDPWPRTSSALRPGPAVLKGTSDRCGVDTRGASRSKTVGEGPHAYRAHLCRACSLEQPSARPCLD
jgi:hypothetical protein